VEPVVRPPSPLPTAVDQPGLRAARRPPRILRRASGRRGRRWPEQARPVRPCRAPAGP